MDEEVLMVMLSFFVTGHRAATAAPLPGEAERECNARAHLLPVGAEAVLTSVARVTNPALALRLRELGLREGAKLTIGNKTAGGGRVVTVDGCRYALDVATLASLDIQR